MKKNNNESADWKPDCILDLSKATGQGFHELIAEFNKSTETLGELGPLKVKNGWHIITPELAEELLRRNRPGTNRRPELVTVTYYAAQMKAGEWPRTGQGLVFSADGWLEDGQHRLWACYLGLVSFDTYIVADVPPVENLFAYLDNSRVRNAATALQTAGLNGLSSLISQTIQIAHNFEIGVYSCQAKKQRTVKMAPIQYLNYLRKHPEIRKGAHLAAGEYRDACEAIGNKAIAAFVVYKIITLHNEEVCDRFMEQISLEDDGFAQDEAVKALNAFLAKNFKAKDPLPKHLILAHVIKAFNACVNGTPLKRVSVPSDDSFPQFVEAAKERSAEDLD